MTPFEIREPIRTYIFPFTAPAGTVTVKLIKLASSTEADTDVRFCPANNTVFADTVELKPLPEIVTVLPAGPLSGLRLVIRGALPCTGTAATANSIKRLTSADAVRPE